LAQLGVAWNAEHGPGATNYVPMTETMDERIPRSFTHYMNRTLTLLSALGAGLMTTVATAQTAPASAAPAPQAQQAPVKPEAIPAKIALISFEQAVFATNEGQKTVQDVQKKYEPKKAQIESLGQEVDTLKKAMQSAPATLTDEERASRLRAIDTKEKALNRDAEEASQAYQADLQEAYGKVATKVNGTMRQYVAQNGYTLLLDVGGQQSPILWAVPNTDVTQAVIDAYNTSSGVAAPPPAAPSAARPRTTTPAHPATTPARPSTAPKQELQLACASTIHRDRPRTREYSVPTNPSTCVEKYVDFPKWKSAYVRLC
jgi:Skp family chaperone for outer membrane proteins